MPDGVVVDGLPAGACTVILLGRSDDGARFAVDVTSMDDKAIVGAVGGAAAFCSGRALLGDGMRMEDAAVAGQALAMVQWHRQHKYCGVTGQPTKSIEAGNKRAGKASRWYPRVDPAVIMLVVSPDGSKALLGSNAGAAVGFFTCLAGFVEPGESLEEAVRREVKEETGVDVGNVALHSSQPWPIGRGGGCELMIGAMAQASTTDISIDPEEMKDARWFDREQAAEMLAYALTPGAKASKDTFTVPGRKAIAHHLIRAFVDNVDPALARLSMLSARL